MIFARVKLIGASSEDEHCLKITMRSICVLDMRDLPMEMPEGFHKRLAAKIEAIERTKTS
jgi:hypothetical protein